MRASSGRSMAAGCGQSLAHTNRSGARLHKLLRQLGHVPVWRPCLRRDVGCGQFQPGSALVEQPADCPIRRVIDPVWLRNGREVIEDQGRGHTEHHALHTHQQVGWHIELQVPAEIVHAMGQRLHGGYTLRIACIERLRKIPSSGDINPRPRDETRWQSSVSVPSESVRSSLGIPVDIPLPGFVPSGHKANVRSVAIRWELTIRASLRGLDYRIIFDVHVYAPNSSATESEDR